MRFDHEGIHDISPTEFAAGYRAVSVGLLLRIRALLRAGLVRCHCGEVGAFRVSTTGPRPYSVFFCLAHKPAASAVEINAEAREVLGALEDV
jgi:hypothetical protein